MGFFDQGWFRLLCAAKRIVLQKSGGPNDQVFKAVAFVGSRWFGHSDIDGDRITGLERRNQSLEIQNKKNALILKRAYKILRNDLQSEKR